MSVSEIVRIANQACKMQQAVLAGATTLCKDSPRYEQPDELLLDYSDMTQMMMRIRVWLLKNYLLSPVAIEWCAVERSNHDSTHYLFVDDKRWFVMTRYKASPQDEAYQQVYHSNDPATNVPEFSVGRVFCRRNLATGLGKFCAERGIPVPNLHCK
ncbi:MAG: hypothetical protein ABI397_02900 [Candidatus Saccharimonas sp.]